MAVLTVNVLQTPSVLLNGEPVAFPFKRADALLYYMLIRRSATRQELIGLLWESCDEAVGLKNLRNTIYTLKKTLGGEILVSPQKSVVTVNEGWEILLDYDRFVRQGDLSAYQGPFLQGFGVKNAFSYEEWLERTREKLQERYLSALSGQAMAAQREGRTELAQQLAQEYLREDPFDEKMAGFLMEQYRQTRQYAKGAQVFQRLKGTLSQELGADPMEATTLLYYELMNEWNAAAAPEGAQARDPVPVGREKAYAVLQAAAVSFRDQGARHCSQLLTGEAGSGKSELIQHFVRRAGEAGFLVLRESCALSEQDRPLAPCLRLMHTVSRRVQQENIPLPEHIRRRLEQYFPSFSSQEEKAARRPADQPLAEALLHLISALSRREKLLVILEDIQWCDMQTLKLVETVLREGESGAVMMVLTRRNNCSPQADALLARCVADALLHEQHLYPLTREETEELLRRELGEEPSLRLAGLFYKETGGDLHLLTELIQACRLRADVDEIISASQDILLGRLAGLSEEALQTAQLISLFPQSAPCSVLLALVEQDDRLLTQGIGELSRRGLIFEENRGAAPAYQFTHQRIRELVYSRQSFFQRRERHLQIAQLLAGEGDVQGDFTVCRTVAWHYRMGDAALPALNYEVQALELETARHCDPFPVFGAAAEGETMEQLLTRLERAQSDLAALRRQHTDGAVLGRLERRLTLIRGRTLLFRGQIAEGSAALGSLSGTAGPEREGELLLQACYLLACCAVTLQSADLAERYASTGIRLAERRGDEVVLAMFERLRGDCFCLRGEYDKSNYYLLQAIETLSKLPDGGPFRLQLAGAYYDFGRVCRQRHDYATACSYYKKALTLLGDKGWCPGAVWIYVHYGRTAFALEDHSRARAMFRRGYELGEECGDLYGLSAAAAYTAYYEMQNENFSQAAKALCRAREVAALLRAPLEEGILCFVSMKMRAALDLGQYSSPELKQLLSEEAEQYARRGIRILSRIPDVFETDPMSRGLKEGITQRQSYRARELYSTNRRFVGE